MDPAVSANDDTADAALRDRAIDAMLALAAEDGWATAGLDDVARRANLALTDVTALASDKMALLALLLDRIDTATLSAADPEAAEAEVRERLFDLIMARFDALAPIKPAMVALMAGVLDDRADSLAAARPFGRSLARLLAAAGVDTQGLGGWLRLNGLGLVYLATFRVWSQDDSPDLGATMAELDKRLGQADGAARWLSTRFGAAPRHMPKA